MLFFLIFLSIILLSAVIYLAISRKTSSRVRMAALGALALMVITVIISVLRFFGDAASETRELVLPDAPVSEVPVQESNTLLLIFLILFLLLMFLIVTVLSLREQRQAKKKKKDLQGF
jgi:preprotein translocase subunit YajC